VAGWRRARRLGLWNHPTATIVVETLLFAGGVWLYLKTTQPVDRVGRWALASLVVVTLAIYFGNSLGPPPPSASLLTASAFGLWLVPFWAWWVDRHRIVVPDNPGWTKYSP